MIISDLTKFGTRVATTFRLELPANVSDTKTVDGLTAAEIAAGVTKTQIGLGQVQNYPLKKAWSPDDQSSPTVYASPATVSGFFNDYYASLFASAANGYSVFVDNSKTPHKAVPEPTVNNSVGPVTTAAELDVSKLVANQQYLYDVPGRMLYRLVDRVWTIQPAGEIPNVIKPNRLYFNKATNKLFYAETSDSLVKF